MPNILAAAIGTQLVGTVYGASQQRKAGKQAQRAAEIEAARMEENAGEAIAASQRHAMEERRKFDLLQSRALALSGAGASDPQIMRIIASLSGEGAYRSSLAMYEGQSKARDLRQQAQAAREGGAAAARAGRTNAITTLLMGGGSLLGKYGGKGPEEEPDV